MENDAMMSIALCINLRAEDPTDPELLLACA